MRNQGSIPVFFLRFHYISCTILYQRNTTEEEHCTILRDQKQNKRKAINLIKHLEEKQDT